MILVTGFEPFDGATSNPTERLVQQLASRQLVDVVARVLPTSYRRSEIAVTAAVREFRPNVVCLLGLHAGATTLRFEQVALNLNQAGKPDNDGDLRHNQRIRETGHAAYFGGLPFEPMRQLAQAQGETLEQSRDAGGFVCNHVYYTVSELLANEFPGARAGFVHVPPLDVPRFTNVSKVLEGWLELFRHLPPQTRA